MFNVTIKSEKDEDICFLIKIENHSFNYICECGEAKSLSVKECQNTNAIFISHTHIDHFVNFDTILRHQIGIGRKVVVCGPKGIISQVQNRIKSYNWNLIKAGAITYEIREILAEGSIRSVTLSPPFWEQENEKQYQESSIFEEKDFYVTYKILNHKTDSIAYAFRGKDKFKMELPKNFKGGKWVADLKNAYESNNKDAQIIIDDKPYTAEDLFYLIKLEVGTKLGFIMDHAAVEENHKKIKQEFLDFDQVFIECFYKDEDKEFAENNYHSYAAMSGKLMKECNVNEATPVHFSRKYENEDIEVLIAQFKNAKTS